MYNLDTGGTEELVHITQYQGVYKSGVISTDSMVFGPCTFVYMFAKSTLWESRIGGVPLY